VKAGVPAFTAPQKEDAMDSLQKRARELGVDSHLPFLLFFWQLFLPILFNINSLVFFNKFRIELIFFPGRIL